MGAPGLATVVMRSDCGDQVTPRIEALRQRIYELRKQGRRTPRGTFELDEGVWDQLAHAISDLIGEEANEAKPDPQGQ